MLTYADDFAEAPRSVTEIQETPSEDGDADSGAVEADSEVPNLGPVDLQELFHRLTNIVPDEQQVVSVPPDTPAGEALELMLQMGFSQLPIIQGGIVLGVFSFRSFARRAIGHRGPPHLDEMPTDEFLEALDTAHPTEELSSIFSALDRDDAVLVGTVDDPLGLVTPMDALRYLYDLAEPYVQLGEIERSLRDIVSRSIDGAELEACAQRALADTYAGREGEIPITAAEMTLGDLVSVVRHGDNYAHFAPILGAQRALVTSRLNPLPGLRNIVFHFRRELESNERERLAETRGWLLRKLWGRNA